MATTCALTITTTIRASATPRRSCRGIGSPGVRGWTADIKKRPDLVTRITKKQQRGDLTSCSASTSHDELVHHDLYALLGVNDTATFDEIKASYRERMKACHPDIAVFANGNEEDAASVSQLMNKAWHTLKDKGRRAMYDSGRVLFGKSSMFKDPFTGVPLSKNARPDLDVTLFVDEGRCIGCHQCKHAAPNTFQMEPHYNVARVETQWADSEEDLEIAVACCPKDCIHTVPKADIALLEWIHRSQPRQRIVACSAESMGGKARGLDESPFVAMERFERKRTDIMRDAEETAKRAAKREEAEAAMEMVSNVVGVSNWFFGRRRPDEKPEEEPRAPSCPLPTVYVNESLLLPQFSSMISEPAVDESV